MLWVTPSLDNEAHCLMAQLGHTGRNGGTSIESCLPHSDDPWSLLMLSEQQIGDNSPGPGPGLPLREDTDESRDRVRKG